MMTDSEKETLARGVAAVEGIFWLLLAQDQVDTPLEDRFISPMDCEKRVRLIAERLSVPR